MIDRMVPGAERHPVVAKNGADVTSAAVRLARAHTGPPRRVLCCGYHGWHDWYIAVTDRRAGIPDEVAASSPTTFAYNDLASAERRRSTTTSPA